MTKSELVERLANRFPNFGQADAHQVVSVMLDAINDTLSRGQRVEVRGFGSFSATVRPPRKARNPKTGEQLEVPQKIVPHFKAGKELRELVDNQ